MEREAPFFYCVSHFVPKLGVALLCVSLCLASASFASPALRSRRSLRAPCHFKAIVLRLVSVKSIQKSIENPSKILPNRLQSVSKITSKSILGASWLPGSIFPRFVRLLGGSWHRPGASWVPSWRQVALQRVVLGATWGILGTSWGCLGASWERLGAS